MEAGRKAIGDVEVHANYGDIVEGHDRRPWVDQRPGRDVRQADDAGEGRPYRAVQPPRPGRRQSRLRLDQLGLVLVKRGLGREALFIKRLPASPGGLGELQVGLSLDHRRFFLPGLEVHQHLTLAHGLPVAEANAGDQLGGVGRQGHGLTALGHAQYLETIVEGSQRDGGGGHRGAKTTAAGTTGSTRGSRTLTRGGGIGGNATLSRGQPESPGHQHQRQDTQGAHQKEVPSDQPPLHLGPAMRTTVSGACGLGPDAMGTSCNKCMSSK